MPHTAEKRAPVTIKHIKDIHFDLINHRSISCDYTPGGISELEKVKGTMTFLKLKGATLNKIKLLTSPILQNIFGVPEEKILDISLTSAFFRLLFSSLTLIWANCLPFYLLIIYMNQNHFFSYDFFLDGIFGMKTFIATAAIAMIFISLAMYGWLIFAKLGFTQTRRNKKNSYRSLTWFFLLISIFFHTLILNLAFESSNIRAAVTILTISFLFIIIILPFVGHNVSQNIQNWKPFLFFYTHIHCYTSTKSRVHFGRGLRCA